MSDQRRYFLEPEPVLTARLDAFLQALRDDLVSRPIAHRVMALMLAGGYGRGEGGIYREREGAEPELYNDLEFYLVMTDGAAAAAAEGWCREREERGTRELGIEVEIKLLTASAIRGAQPSMFFYDLLAAHRLVYGSEKFVHSLPDELRDSARIPGHEVARLLFNRGSGLFFSACALEAGDARARNGFVERNHAKARLSLADAVLALNGRYHFSCVERHRRLGQPLNVTPPGWEDLIVWHAEGVAFKLRPRHRYPTLEELRQSQERLSGAWLRTFLWVESRRLRKTFSDAGRYARYRGPLFPETAPWRNFALHARDRLKRGAALPNWFDYPRASLQRSLALASQHPPDFKGAAVALGLKVPLTLPELQRAYERWWNFYN